jgi:ADP-ribosyl-[dinitrogen reductase] hydrolase
MIGAIIGDIIGSTREGKKSVFENEMITAYISNNGRREVLEKPEPILHAGLRFTDDSVLTVATEKALRTRTPFAPHYRRFYQIHASPLPGMNAMEVGFGPNFTKWGNQGAEDAPAPPYNSFGNGSAMRVSPVAYRGDSLAEVSSLAALSAACTHSHPDGVLGAVVLAQAIYLARTGHSAQDIHTHVVETSRYMIDFEHDDLVAGYQFNPTCQGSVPHAIWAALRGPDFTSVMRTCLAIGGDTDTICAMAGSLAEPLWGVPLAMREQALAIVERDGPFLFDELLIGLNDGPYAESDTSMADVPSTTSAGHLALSTLTQLKRRLLR